MGDRITGIPIDGLPIDLTQDYRVGTFSFLLEGGDNFREFTNGTNTTDSGLIDRDGWISYIEANSPLSPSFDRRGVSVTGVPETALNPGATGTVQLDKLDLTSLGSPANTSVSAAFAGSAATAEESQVSAGSSTVTFTVPADVVGTGTLILTASPSGTVVRVPIAVNAIVVPPVDPTEGDVTEAAGEDSLDAELRDLISLSSNTAEAGQSLEVFVGTKYAGERVYGFLYSTPTSLGSFVVDAAGNIQVMIPANTPAGAHRIAIQDASGAVIGWADITVNASTTAGGGSGSLAQTGSEIAPLLIGAMLLLTLGGAFVLARGRRSLYPQSTEA
jgi:5'-nucleotidase